MRSRTIRFGYRALSPDTAFSETTDISLGVVARLCLSRDRTRCATATSCSSAARPRRPERLRKVVELQVRKGWRWMTFRSTRLRNGRFSERYRFTRTAGR